MGKESERKIKAAGRNEERDEEKDVGSSIKHNRPLF